MFISQRSVSVNPGKQLPSFRFSLFSFWLLTENQSDRRELSHFASSWLDVTQRSGFKPRSAPTLTPPPQKIHKTLTYLFPLSNENCENFVSLFLQTSQNPSSPVSQLIRYLICKEWKHLFNPSACIECASLSSCHRSRFAGRAHYALWLHPPAPPLPHVVLSQRYMICQHKRRRCWIMAWLWFMATSA